MHPVWQTCVFFVFHQTLNNNQSRIKLVVLYAPKILHEEENPESKLIRKYSRLSLFIDWSFVRNHCKSERILQKVVSTSGRYKHSAVSRKWYMPLDKRTILRSSICISYSTPTVLYSDYGIHCPSAWISTFIDRWNDLFCQPKRVSGENLFCFCSLFNNITLIEV